MPEEEEGSLSRDETDLYDRQIRLWGLEAQTRLRSSSLVLIGLDGIGGEIAKNIVLSGVKALTIIDDNPINGREISSGLFVAQNSIGQKKSIGYMAALKQLNPNVSINHRSLPAEQEELKRLIAGHQMVCVCDRSLELAVRLNDVCRQLDVLFLAGWSFGYYGCVFVDLLHHVYAQDVSVRNEDGSGSRMETKQCTTDYVCLRDAVKLAENIQRFTGTKRALKKLRQLVPFLILHALESAEDDRSNVANLQAAFRRVLDSLSLKPTAVFEEDADNDVIATVMGLCHGELSPVCSVVGGIAAQEVIRALSKKDEVMNNWLFFNGLDCSSYVEKFGVFS